MVTCVLTYPADVELVHIACKTFGDGAGRLGQSSRQIASCCCLVCGMRNMSATTGDATSKNTPLQYFAPCDDEEGNVR